MWSYNSAIPTAKDKVRLLIGDVIPARPLLEDEEILYFLELSGNDEIAAAARAADAVAARVSADPNFAVSAWREDRESVVRRYREMARNFRLSRQSVIWTGERKTPYFEVGMMDYVQEDHP